MYIPSPYLRLQITLQQSNFILSLLQQYKPVLVHFSDSLFCSVLTYCISRLPQSSFGEIHFPIRTWIAIRSTSIFARFFKPYCKHAVNVCPNHPTLATYLHIIPRWLLIYVPWVYISESILLDRSIKFEKINLIRWLFSHLIPCCK